MASAGKHIVLVIALVIVGVATAPMASLVIIPLVVVGLSGARGFLSLTRPTRRLRSTGQSLMIQTFSTALEGVATLRAFGRTADYLRQATGQIDDWSAASAYMRVAYEWLSIRLESVAAHLCAVVAIALALNKNTTPAMAGWVQSWFGRRLGRCHLLGPEDHG